MRRSTLVSVSRASLTLGEDSGAATSLISGSLNEADATPHEYAKVLAEYMEQKGDIGDDVFDEEGPLPETQPGQLPIR
eukprot:CAMPEP_0197686920 /NCGR_PEP_ID=MMETSP1338-20131121/103239_1 /TAXON_ID=43686 ORGANISM="Pelagodinium beii, Strain RCC1491" /NCGR_SAMPLE_ID=MMETSP1338 /ASSEMBLY_ACC=CAM_ASM_000754 /LENGTH=77 /DNA_ID=CAMNT_0043268929 /DNA_START=52 /DNA_END=281 /DNA_ORIENTATION=+